MNILVACEESQAVTIELRKLGHRAFSCDLIECSGGHPEWHLQVDALELLKLPWDMIIAHPPCTYLTNAGAVRMRVGGRLWPNAIKRLWKQKISLCGFILLTAPESQ